MPLLPFFSIIIPTYQRAAQLSRCLLAIANLNYPRDRFEVIVVDDGGDQPLDQVIASVADQIEIKLLRQTNSGPGLARNSGATLARGDYLAFTDDDCRPDPNWLNQLAAGFKRWPADLVGGETINGLPNNHYSTASQLLISYLYSYFNADPEQAVFLTGNNIALPTRQFFAVGGFNTGVVGEDREFCYHWRQLGLPIRYWPPAIIYHDNRNSFTTFWQQQYYYGRATRSLGLLFRSQQRQLRQPLSFYWQLLYFPLRSGVNSQTLMLMLLFFITQLATTCGYLWECCWPRINYLPRNYSDPQLKL